MRRRSAITAACLVAGFLATGCASQDTAQNDVCPANHTLVCHDRMGKAEECVCTSKAKMRDVFDLRKSR